MMSTPRWAPHDAHPMVSALQHPQGEAGSSKWGWGVAVGSPSQVLAVPVPALDALGRLSRGQQAACRWLLAWLGLSFQPEESQCWRAPERRAAGTHAGLVTLSCVPGQPPAPPVMACLGAIPSWAGHIHPLLASCCPEHPRDRLRVPCALPCCVQARVLPAKGQPCASSAGQGSPAGPGPRLGSAQTRAGGGAGHWGLAAVPIVPRSPASAVSRAPQCSVCRGPVPCGIPQTSPAGSRELCSQQLGRIDALIRHQYGEGAGRSPGFDQAGTEEADISHQRPAVMDLPRTRRGNLAAVLPGRQGCPGAGSQPGRPHSTGWVPRRGRDLGQPHGRAGLCPEAEERER